MHRSQSQGVVTAFTAAVLFGASTPLAKGLLVGIDPVLLAGLLYAGSGIGLGAWLLLRRLSGVRSAEAGLQARDAPWLAGAVLFGGILGPVLLMLGLRTTPASTASLLLNLESVLTAVLAWTVFRENVDRRVLLGMISIVAGGVVLSRQQQTAVEIPWGALAIAGACLCWAIDNNLTRAVSGGDPTHIATIKGGTAGAVNIGIALILGSRFPAVWSTLEAGAIGLAGYGVSLVCFVLALRQLGTARTGAYFSTAPFVGAALSLWLYSEWPGMAFWIAGALMAIGVWLHLNERHEHAHEHEALEHEHGHRHDEHHQHAHHFPWNGEEPHSHPHKHEPLVHAHPHFPDIHHRHDH